MHRAVEAELVSPVRAEPVTRCVVPPLWSLARSRSLEATPLVDRGSLAPFADRGKQGPFSEERAARQRSTIGLLAGDAAVALRRTEALPMRRSCGAESTFADPARRSGLA
jgi:hypothetical protein